MKVVIRVDASHQIGTGHVMRCMTLAKALTARGDEVSFICRAHTGHLMDWIQQKGFNVHGLPAISDRLPPKEGALAHYEWLGAPPLQDAQACRKVLEGIQPDWLIVDHYAIDEQWESALQDTYHHLMVLDDLADRVHVCDLLLDQTYGHSSDLYKGRVPNGARLLLGTRYALLRSEFLHWRERSLARRQSPVFQKILITLGGVDRHHVTGQLLNALVNIVLPAELEITVIMGAQAPHLNSVQAQIQTMSPKTCVKVGVENMAELMTESDLVISAAGSTAWEVACLGVPLVLLKLAENQTDIMKALLAVEAVWAWDVSQLEQEVQVLEKISPPLLKKRSEALSKCSDGQGVSRVLHEMNQISRVHG